MITIEQYLLLKNTLNLQLTIALQKISLVYANQDSQIELEEAGVFGKNGIFGKSGIYDLSTAAFQIKWFEERLMLVDKYYNEKMSFDKIVEKIGLYLLPPK